MLDKTAQLTARRFVAEGSRHFGEYGLDRPSNEIQVTGTGGTETIYLGSTNSATGDCYMAVGGSEKIYTVDSTFANLFSSSLNAMAIRETLPGISLDNMTMVTVEEKGGTFTFSRSGPGDGAWNVSEKIGTERPADSGLVSGCLGKLVKLRYEEMTVYRPLKARWRNTGWREQGNTGSLIRIVSGMMPGRMVPGTPARIYPGKEGGADGDTWGNLCCTWEETAKTANTPMYIRKAGRGSML